tara:strand:- start:2858 stop:3172 length:315 start_codon:yes stop_codon:yes gene_type:complete
MNIFFIFYFLLSFIICYSLNKTLPNNIYKILIMSIFISILFPLWFIEPGFPELAPVFVIIFLENTIIESHGNLRLLRPILAIWVMTFILFISFWSYKKLFPKKK